MLGRWRLRLKSLKKMFRGMFSSSASRDFKEQMSRDNARLSARGGGASSRSTSISSNNTISGRASYARSSNDRNLSTITGKPSIISERRLRQIPIAPSSPSSSYSSNKYNVSGSSSSSRISRLSLKSQSDSAIMREKERERDEPDNKVVSSKSASDKLCCDKCDGKHETSACPHFKKDRENHPDAKKNFYKKFGGSSKLPGQTIRSGYSIQRQPGDGSCLFHSMSYGLGDGSNASSLRREICRYIVDNPDAELAGNPLKEWIKWDSNCSVRDYARRMSGGAWGGGIEMAVFAKLKGVNLHVYERGMLGIKRISAFDQPVEADKKKIVRVIYEGGVHYNSVVYRK